MQKNYRNEIFFLFVCLLLVVSKDVFAAPIELLFPHAFEGHSGINVHPKMIGGIAGFEIEEFPLESASRNHWDSRGEQLCSDKPVQFLVIHYTECDFSTALHLFTSLEPDERVSAHYVITQHEGDHGIVGGIPIQIVPEDKRARHAGVSAWRGSRNLNATSIGIEMINQGVLDSECSPWQWSPFDPAQIATLGRVSQEIVQRYQILPQNVVGHNDIAPTRKVDPGILFPWKELHLRYGVGAWLTEEERSPSFISDHYNPKEPLPRGVSEAFFLRALRNYGYDCRESPSITPDHFDVVKAFKSHFSCNQCVESYTPTIDENDMLWAWGLEAKYKR